MISGVDGPKANPAIESILTAAATNPTSNTNNTLHIAADNVTVDGLVVDGNNPTLVQSGAVVVNGVNTDVRRGIQTENAAGAFVAANNVIIRYNVIQNFAQRGVELVNPTDTSPATSGSLVTRNLVRNFGITGVLLAFNHYGDVTFNTIVGSDFADAAVMIQDFPNNGGLPKSIDISNNTMTVGQDSTGIWPNLMYAPAATLAIHDNTVNAAAGVTGTDDFTYGIYLTSLQNGVTATVNNNIVGSAGGQFARGIALWNLPTTTPVSVSGGTVGNSVKGVSLQDNDPNFGLAGSNSAVNLSGVSISGSETGISVDAVGSAGDTVAMQISGNTSIAFTTTAISVTGANASANIHDNSASIHDCTVGVRVIQGSATITSNNFYANVTSLAFSLGASGTAHFNRIISTTNAIENPSNLTPNLENNWWGCNAGPGNAGCGAVTGTGADFDPWIVLLGSATPSTINPGGTSTVAADMTHNSAAAVPSGTLPNIPDSYSATNGTMNPTTSTVAAGADSSLFTSTNSNSAIATITVDNQLVNVPITVNTPAFSIDDVTHLEGSPSGTTSYVFTVTKTGATTFASSVNFTTVNGTATVADNDYQANSGTLNFGPTDTTMQITVLVNKDNAVEPDEAFTVHLDTPVNATISDADGTGTIQNDDTCTPPSTVYVDASWVGTTPGTDPDGGGPATNFGCDSFATIQNGVNGVAPGGTVDVYAGTYNEDVNVNIAGLKLLGAGAGVKTIIGPIGGPGTTVAVTASNVTVAGFTITRAGNTLATWNDPNLNIPGVGVQGQSVTGMLLRDNIITGNRTGIDINNSNGHTIRNNQITDNRTGLIFRNQTDNMTVVENEITNNWTVGLLFLDASGGTNSPVQTALHGAFNNNNFSGNWYGQIVDRQSGGSLPAPATTNYKNFRGNWFGTTSPVITTANSTEPGYAAQIPVAFGGAATPPGGQPDIAGPASANFQYTPFLLSGTDTNVETTPGRGTNGFQGVPNTVVVTPANMNGWVFFDDLPGTGTGSGSLVLGPATPPQGTGSARLQVDSLGRFAFATGGYAGTRMDDLLALLYGSYMNANANQAASIAFQFDIDYDLNDANTAYAGRLVFEPGLLTNLTQNVWQNWDPRAGVWYGTRTSVVVNNVPGVVQPCQMATPCTYAQVLALFPDAGVRNNPFSGLIFKAGGPVGSPFDGNVDGFTLRHGGAVINYDFEPAPQLSIDDVTHLEGSPSGTTAYVFTVTKTGASTSASSVNFSTVNGTATQPSDYTPNSGTLNFGPSDTTMQITVLVNRDTTFEPNEAFTIHLDTPVNATIADADGTGTITNDDTAPTVSINDVTHAEGNSGTTDYDFTVSLSNASYQTITVNAATANDSATTANSDYTAVPSTLLTFSPDTTTQHVHVLVNGDLTVEPDEQFFVNLSGATFATILKSQGVGAIVNDDTNVTVAVSPASVAEDGATNLVYTFTRNPLTSGPITVNFSVGGTADFGTDYTQTGAATFGATSGTVIIPNGSTTKTVTIDPTADTTVEPDETAILTVTSGTGYNVGGANSATGTITNDDTDVTVAVSPASVLEDGAPNLVYTFTRTGVTSGAITANFSVGGTATFPSDYAQTGAASFGASSGTVTFGDGITTATVTIDPTPDVIYESNETAILTVASGTGYNPGVPVAATGTITNDDAKPTLSIGDRIAFEGTTGGPTTDFVFTVTKTGGTEVTANVDFATANGTTNPATGGATCGTPGVDYETKTGSLTFLANETTKTITIAVCKDSTVESNETFFVNLSNESEATLTDSQGQGTIQNDDSPGTVVTVNTTDDVSNGLCDSHCTLRDAITALNGSLGPDAVGINFAIPASDARHFYYADDGIANHVTNDLAHVLVTTATDDTMIVGIDPDWPHSWWSILPTTALQPITHQAVVDGSTQTGWIANTLTGADNAVLRIELSGASAGAASGLTLNTGASTVKGLVINRFTSHGLDLQGGTGNNVTGNFIGTDVSGTLDLGNAANGVSTTGSSLTVGGVGSTPGDMNVISGNDGDGIALSSSNSDLVLGNLIGTKANGISALGNTGNGISFSGAGSAFNTVGTTQPGDGNTIAFNGGDGVQVGTTAGIGNSIRGNSISSNGTTSLHLGIDLDVDGVAVNDATDPDPSPSPSRANNLQNFPIITSALVTGSTRTITGTLNSTPGQTFDIDFYQSPSCDTSGYGEGKTYIGSTSVTTDGAGNVASFTFHPVVLTIGQMVTATATTTGASFSTSEFSLCSPVNDGSSGAGDIQFTSAAYTVGEGGGTAAITVTRTGGSNGSITANFSTSNGTAQAPGDYTAVTNFPITYVEGEIVTKTVTVSIVNDTTFEGNETVNLSLGSTQINAAHPEDSSVHPELDPHAAVLTITENDPAPTLTINDVTHNEGNGGTTAYTFTVTKTGSTALNATVDYASANGTAAAGSDYVATGGTLTFNPGDLTKTIGVTINGDQSFEPNETFFVNLTNAVNATISQAQGTGTILNDDAQGGIIRFSSATYNTTESSGSVTITVERVGDTTAAATVDYATPDDSAALTVVPCATINGLASPRCDFTTALGTLRWAAGDGAPKTFNVLISQDNYVEGDETLPLTLSNLTGGAVFGVPSTATLTIADDATEPAANPIDDTNNFVRQHYHDFLNREPDASGLAFWTNEITSCGSNQQCIDFKRVQVSAAFYLSIEFQDTGYLVERLYKSSYGDVNGLSTLGGSPTLPVPIVRFSEFLPDTQEIGQGVVVGAPGWPLALEANRVAFADKFVQRARFITAFPLSMTPEQFVDTLNLNAGNPLSTAERNQLVADLTSNTQTRAQVLRAVAEDQDLKNAEFNRAFVLMQYFGYLRRNPNSAPDTDYTGYDFWLTKLNQFNGNFQNADMVKAFIVSGEYRNRSGQ